jgi:hypothetical protein
MANARTDELGGNSSENRFININNGRSGRDNCVEGYAGGAGFYFSPSEVELNKEYVRDVPKSGCETH